MHGLIYIGNFSDLKQKPGKKFIFLGLRIARVDLILKKVSPWSKKSIKFPLMSPLTDFNIRLDT